MILVDTSVWVQHLRAGDGHLAARLHEGLVLTHPWVVGERALGHVRQRDTLLDLLAGLPQGPVATPDETLLLIDSAALRGTGIGYLDAHLLASVRLLPGASLWTHDRRLAAQADRLGQLYGP